MLTREDEAYVTRVWDRVHEAAKRKGRPLPTLPGPGFLMIGIPYPTPPKVRRQIPEHILLGMLGSLIVSVATLAFLYFAAPSIFNL
jgi:hypothetical protein